MVAKEESLTDYIKRNEKLITVLGVFFAILAYVIASHPNEIFIQVILFGLILITWWELVNSHENYYEGHINLRIFRLLIVTLGGWLFYYASQNLPGFISKISIAVTVGFYIGLAAKYNFPDFIINKIPKRKFIFCMPRNLIVLLITFALFIIWMYLGYLLVILTYGFLSSVENIRV